MLRFVFSLLPFFRTPKGVYVKVIVGLGNVGNEYKKTRHNAGFMVVDQFSKKHRIPVENIKFKAVFGEGALQDVDVLIIKPLTFMNLSGVAVKKFFKKYSVAFEDLLVVHDDIDLILGKVKKKTGGGDAGHLGIRSIIQSLESRDFSRIRVGIGRPEDNSDISDWVLTPFSKEEKITLKESIDIAVQKIEEFLK